MVDIIKFLRNEGTDFKGRKLIDLLDGCDEELEQSHDFIQWMFPTDIPSNHSDFAPVLTKEQIEVIRNDDKIKENLKTCLLRMLIFYQGEWWISTRNHNFLRITRILRCLWLADLKWEYEKFQEVIDRGYAKHHEIIGKRTYQFWKNANNDKFFNL